MSDKENIETEKKKREPRLKLGKNRKTEAKTATSTEENVIEIAELGKLNFSLPHRSSFLNKKNNSPRVKVFPTRI